MDHLDSRRQPRVLGPHRRQQFVRTRATLGDMARPSVSLSPTSCDESASAVRRASNWCRPPAWPAVSSCRHGSAIARHGRVRRHLARIDRAASIEARLRNAANDQPVAHFQRDAGRCQRHCACSMSGTRGQRPATSAVSVNARGMSATGSGRLSQRSGSGRWSGDACSGTWSAQRRNNGRAVPYAELGPVPRTRRRRPASSLHPPARLRLRKVARRRGGRTRRPEQPETGRARARHAREVGSRLDCAAPRARRAITG